MNLIEYQLDSWSCDLILDIQPEWGYTSLVES